MPPALNMSGYEDRVAGRKSLAHDQNDTMPKADLRRELIDELLWERDLAAGAQFLRQQAMIDVRVSRGGDLRLLAETHHRSIPIFQFTGLPVHNVALQGRSAAGW